MDRKSVKKTFQCIGYILLTVVCIVGIYILIVESSNKENDNIVQATDSSTYFRNINPRFVIDFVNGEYIRFETVSSYSNPFEGKKQSIWEKIKYSLGIKQDRKGIEISLIDVSYDTQLLSILDKSSLDIPKDFELNKSFELTSIGREFGNEEEAVSKDTVISKNVYKGVDIEYQVIQGKGLKEEIVLNELPEYTQKCGEKECSMPVNRFLFKLKLDEGLTIKRSIDSNTQYPAGTYYIVDSIGNYYAHFLPEFAVDALGYKSSDIVSNISVSDNNEYLYEIVLDPEWLLSSERTFPIRIDPSIIHDGQETFDLGIYDRVILNSNLTLGIDSQTQKSGTYTSSILEFQESSILRDISWYGYGEATGSGELPFSELDLLFNEYFNESVSNKVKWGEGALELSTGESKKLNIFSSSANNISLEFWSYRRHLSDEQSIFLSDLGSLGIKESKYVFTDSLGTQYLSEIPVKYNDWQYISLIFNISSNQLTVYVDEYEYQIESVTYNKTTLDTLTFEGQGYIDTVRVYERVLARNEIVSNSQYTDLHLQLMSSLDGNTWGEWDSKLKYFPLIIPSEESLEIQIEEESVNSYDVISFDFLLESEEQVRLGDSKFNTGVKEESTVILEQQQGVIEGVEEIKYLDLVFTPMLKQSSCVLALEGVEIYTLDTGKVDINIGGVSPTIEDMYEVNMGNHLAISVSQGSGTIYLNGNAYEFTGALPIISESYSIGNGCSNPSEIFDGEISSIRVSNTLIDQTEILKYSNIQDREYILRPVFRALLQSNQQISDINDTEFSISEMSFGATNYISNLNVGDGIVVKEGEYFVEGTVSFIQKDTGSVKVERWIDGGTLPEGGFTTEASVLKWQTEYIPLKDFLNQNILPTSVVMGYASKVDIKNVLLFSGIEAGDTSHLSQNEGAYVKYRVVFTSSKYAISPYISSIKIEYEQGGPSMEQIMRHGKWFDGGVKQPFWWSN